MEKFKKVYCIFHLLDDMDLPYRWVTEKTPYWFLFEHDGYSIITGVYPETNDLVEMYKHSSIEPSEYLFDDFKSAEHTCSKKNLLPTHKFYFTFGTSERFPYQGGWVEVFAHDCDEAIQKFNENYGMIEKDVVNCSFIYSEKEFKKTSMFTGSNKGDKCHEVLL